MATRPTIVPGMVPLSAAIERAFIIDKDAPRPGGALPVTGLPDGTAGIAQSQVLVGILKRQIFDAIAVQCAWPTEETTLRLVRQMDDPGAFILVAFHPVWSIQPAIAFVNRIDLERLLRIGHVATDQAIARAPHP
jgi:hypothetical protein